MTEIQIDTLDHINKVIADLEVVVKNLRQRAFDHDASKLEEPELSIFTEVSPLLSEVAYGSPEYMERLARLKPAIEHHYACNTHHPEHWPNGINDMSLLDIIEMLADWKAAGERTKGGNLQTSIEFNIKRFGIGEQLADILINTAKELGWL